MTLDKAVEVPLSFVGKPELHAGIWQGNLLHAAERPAAEECVSAADIDVVVLTNGVARAY